MSGRFAPSELDREADGIDPDSIDTGEPIQLLRKLEEPTPPGFLGRLRRRIDRTKFAGDATTFAWAAPWVLLRELLGMLFPTEPSSRDDSERPRRP
ncbi:MAG: hypothetical protein AAGA81_22095 [Acidobacteriota bacterium]